MPPVAWSLALRRRWPPSWTAAGLLVVAGLFRASQNMALTTFPLLGRQYLHLGTTVIGALGTVTGVTGIAATLAVGVRVSTSRATASVAAGTALLAVALLVFAGSGSIAPFALGTVLLGLAGGSTTPSLATAVGAADPRERDRALARYAFVLSLSLAAGPLLETGLLTLAGQRLRVPFLAFGALPLAGLVWGMAGRRKAPGEEAPGEEAVGMASVGGPEVSSPPLAVARPLAVVASPGGRLALTVQLLYAVPFSAVIVFGGLIARDVYGLSAAGAQAGFTAFFSASLLTRLVVARRSPIRRKLRVFAASVALTLAGLALLAVGGSAGLFFGAMVLLGIPHGVTFPLVLALVAESVPSDRLAQANATLFAATSAVSVVAPVVLGAVAAAAGYRVMTAVVLAPVAAFAGLLAAQRRARRPSAAD